MSHTSEQHVTEGARFIWADQPPPPPDTPIKVLWSHADVQELEAEIAAEQRRLNRDLWLLAVIGGSLCMNGLLVGMWVEHWTRLLG